MSIPSPVQPDRSGRVRRLGLLLALYFVQGLPFGFQATALPIYLRERGVSLTAIGFAGALALPWLLKIFWAPLVDRFSSSRIGRRKSWILPAQAGLALTCLAAGTISPESNLALLLALVFLMNLFAATQDIAVDGLAVDVLRPEELGPGNAAQVVGYKLGMLTGGGLLVWATAHLGWSGVFMAMAALVGAVWVLAALTKEPDRRGEKTDDTARTSDILRALRMALATRRSLGILLLIATYKMGETMIDRMFTPFLVDAGFSGAQIGAWVGTWGMAFSIAGSIAGGILAARAGLSRALWWTALLRIFPLVGELALTLAPPSADAVIGVTCAEHFFGGALTTVMFAMMMASVDRRIGSTHFTALAVVEVFGKSPGAWASGALADALGYTWVFGSGLALSVGFFALVIGVRPTFTHSDVGTQEQGR